MYGIKIKPLSVNKAWQGRRYKTVEYKTFENKLLYMLPDIEVPSGPLILKMEFGFSNGNCDCSNPVKLVEDILQKKYKFNDNRIFEIRAQKKIVKKGAEYIIFSLLPFLPEKHHMEFWNGSCVPEVRGLEK